MASASLIISTPGPTANCYVAAADGDTPAEADAYFANTLREATWASWTTSDRERALIQATQELERLGGEWQSASLNYFVNGPPVEDYPDGYQRVGRARFTGLPHLITQSLHFPRWEDLGATGVADIPKNIKAACCEQAFHVLSKRDNPDLIPRGELQAQGVRSISVDGLSESYGSGRVPEGIAPAAWSLMKPYILRSLRVSSWGRTA